MIGTVRTEADIGLACDRLAIAAGFAVERYEQRRRTMITEGIPDRRYPHVARGLRLWVELKAPGGKLTREQHAWLLSELEAGAIATVIDDDAQLRELLRILAGPRVGRDAQALTYCRQLLFLTAARGYRGEKADPTTKRTRKPARTRSAR